MFMPSPGPLSVFRMPEADRSACAIDSGYRQGDQVTPFYDPMLAKIVVWAEDRSTALARAITALNAVQVTGIHTNRDFLLSCLADPLFAAGDIHTGFIDARLKTLLAA